MKMKTLDRPIITDLGLLKQHKLRLEVQIDDVESRLKHSFKEIRENPGAIINIPDLFESHDSDESEAPAWVGKVENFAKQKILGKHPSVSKQIITNLVWGMLKTAGSKLFTKKS